MTASPFTITPTPPTSLVLPHGQEGRFSFTVHSLAAPDKAHEVMLQALTTGADGRASEVEWLVAGPHRSMTLAGGKTETVTITARPTAKVAPGEHSIKLAIAVADRPNDEYVYSPPVACEVVAQARPTVAKKPFPLWLILVIGGLVVLVGGGLLVWKLAGSGDGGAGMGQPCGDGKECATGLLCAESQQCLLAGGIDCEQDTECASGECEDRNAICATPIGAACDPGERDQVPCPTNAVCDPASKRCIGNIGARCSTDGHCATEKCTGNQCVMKAPPINPGEPCVDACPEPMTCSATNHVCVEQIGRPCTESKQCASGLCEQAVCAEPRLGRNCTADGICGPDQKCFPVQTDLMRCGWAPGHPCAGNAECSSSWCNGGTCSRDDGKCESASDCQPPFQCFTDRQRCLKPDAVACGSNAECASSYCSPAGCAPSPCPACPQFHVCNNDPQSPRCLPIAYQPRRPAWVRDAVIGQ